MSAIFAIAFFIAFSVLSYQIILLKFFSFKMLSSWAFLIFGMAFLGIGAAGSYLYIKKFKDNKNIDFSFLFKNSLLYTILLPVSIFVFAWLPYSPPKNLFFVNLIFNLFYFLLFSVPFFLSSVCITYIISRKEFKAGKILFFDLFGAGLGCLFTVMFIRQLGAYGILIVTSISALIATFIFFTKIQPELKPKYIYSFIIPTLVIAFIPFFPGLMISKYGFDINSTNREEHHFTCFKDDFKGIQATYWNGITRLDLSHEGYSDNEIVFLIGLSPEYTKKKYRGRFILQDSSASTRQFYIDENEDNSFLESFIFSIPYHVKKNIDNVLLIGPGGGVEISIVKRFGIKYLDAVDINADMIEILKGTNKSDPLNNVYSKFTTGDENTKVNFIVDEGRSFMSRKQTGKYDIVELSGVDTMSALLSGGKVMSDNYLYTREALNLYYNAVKDDGIVNLSYAGGHYSLRLFITALEMLERNDVKDPGKSIFAIYDGDFYNNIIIKKGAFTEGEIERAEKFANEKGFKILYSPTIANNENIKKATDRTLKNKEDMSVFWRNYPLHRDLYLTVTDQSSRSELLRNFFYKVDPVTDDKPFFYSVINKTKDENPFMNFLSIIRYPFQSKDVMVYTLIGVVCSFLFILLPLILNKSDKEKKPEQIVHYLLFFGLMGFSFSLLEPSVLNKFSIFVGGPFFSMAVTLASILIAYSIGAYCTTIIKMSPFKLLVFSIIGLILYNTLVISLLSKSIIDYSFALPHLFRIVITIFLIFPLGFLLGFPLPIFIETIKEKMSQGTVAWMWGANSCANVIGSLMFVPISRLMGFNNIFIFVGVVYILALGILLLNKQLART